MYRIQLLVHKIQLFINGCDQTDSPLLRDLYNDYIAEIDYLNTRLMQCNALLEEKRSLKAVLLAERFPTLFDIIPLLQTSEVQEFAYLCKRYSLPLPELNWSTFYKLNTIRSQVCSKDELIAEWHSLPVSSLLEDKLILLRLIQKLDPVNLEWKRLLLQNEELFLQDLMEKLHHAVEINDYKLLAEIDSLLSESGLKSKVSPSTIDNVCNILDTAKQNRLHLQADALLTSLENAYNENNLFQYAQIKNQWDMLLNGDNYIPSRDEELRFGKIADYFATQQSEFALGSDYAELSRKIFVLMSRRDDISVEEVELLYNKLCSLGQPVDDKITGFVCAMRNIRDRKIRKAKTKIFLWRFGCIFASFFILLCGGIVTWYLYFQKSFAKSLFESITAGDLQKSKDTVAALKASWLPYLTLSDKLNDYVLLVADQEKDHEKFLVKAKEAEALLQAAPSEDNIEKISELLFACRLQVKNLLSRSYIDDLERQYTDYKEKVAIQNQALIDARIEEIKSIFEDYKQKISLEEFASADDLYRKYHNVLTVLHGYSSFDLEKITDSSRKYLLIPANWLCEKHKILLTKINALNMQSRFADVLKMIDIYEANESLLKHNSLYAENNFPSSHDLKQKNQTQLMQDTLPSLLSLEKELRAATSVEVPDCDDLISSYDKDYQLVKDLSLIPDNLKHKFSRLTSPEIFAKISEAKNLFAIAKSALKEHLANYKDHSSRQKMIDAITAAQNSLNFSKLRGDTASQRRFLGPLGDQIRYLGAIYDCQNGGEFQNDGEEFFIDAFRFNLINKSGVSRFKKLYSKISNIAAYNEANKQVHLVFRDSKLKMHYLKGALRELLATIEESNNSISFEMSGQRISILNKNTITIGAADNKSEPLSVYNNVRFVYPRDISVDTLRNAVEPDQQISSDILGQLSQCSQTIISSDYYKVLDDLRKSRDYSVQRKMEMLAMLLDPVIDGCVNPSHKPPFKNISTSVVIPALQAFYEDFKDKKQEIDSDAEIFDRHEMEQKYASEIEALDLSKVRQLIEILEVEKEHLEFLISRDYNCIGVITNAKGKPVLLEIGDGSYPDGEIWAFDSALQLHLIGVFEGGELKWNDSIQNISSSVAIMPMDNIDTVAAITDYRNRLSELANKKVMESGYLTITR